MPDFEYLIANDFDRAWLNFELDLPLEPGPRGEPNPFYVDRPGNPTTRLERALNRPFRQPPKFFFSGHRGCKSTELPRDLQALLAGPLYHPRRGRRQQPGLQGRAPGRRRQDVPPVPKRGQAGRAPAQGTGRLARELGLHLELTTLVIPGVNDRAPVLQGIAERIVAELGAEVPWHVSGYYPAYRFTAPPTPVSTLERAWRIGKEAGLEFVYLGNVLGHRLENTYCPDCEALLVERWGLGVTRCDLEGGRCPQCGREIPGVWAASL